MKDLEKDLLTAISEQETNIEQIEELEEVIAPATGCGCGGLCQ
jgi:hypothetical protein